MRETCQWPQANCYSPTTMFQNMSLNQHQYVEENWPDNNNCVEFVEGNPMTSPVEVYSHPCERNLQWNQQQTPQNEVYQNNRYYSQHENQDTREVIEQSELQFSEHNIGSESQQEKVENSAVKSQSLASNNSCSSDQESAQFEQQNAETFHSPAEYAEFNPQQSDNHKPVENNGASQYPHTQHPYNAPAADQNCLQNNMYAPSNYVMPHAPPQYIAPNLPSFHNSVGPNVQPRGNF
uniref:Uncharacterized protein n=1 Tax=Ciona savignyi TaxID=51511 RepID=H2ZHV6_CIOSA